LEHWQKAVWLQLLEQVARVVHLHLELVQLIFQVVLAVVLQAITNLAVVVQVVLAVLVERVVLHLPRVMELAGVLAQH
jgi:hypothetical protein